jgi:uncharacterized protein (TIGR03435 family)
MKQFLLATLTIAAIHAPDAFAQKFDVASVRINRGGSAGGEGKIDESIKSAPGSLIMRNVTLLSCMKWAYGVRDFQISGSPGWFSTERYDISARAAGPSDDVELRKMLQALLADRFQLRVRQESKQLPVYELTVSRQSPGMKPAVGNETGSMRPEDGALVFRNTSMAEFAERLGIRPMSLDRPVLDKTGLNGGYDFSLKFATNTVELKAALEDVDRGGGQSTINDVLKQLGLKLEPQRAALPVFVVEHAVGIPEEN